MSHDSEQAVGLESLPHRRGRWLTATLLFLTVALVLSHTNQCVWLLGGLGGILSDTPLLAGDYSLHGYYCLMARVDGYDSFWERLWAYDPYFMAGYPKTALFPTSSVYYELFTSLFPVKQVWQGLKLAVLASGLLPCFALALVAWQNGPRSALLAGALVVLTFWAEQPYEFYVVGLGSWLVGSALAVAGLSLAARVWGGARLTEALLLSFGTGLCWTAALWAHLLSGVVITVGIAGGMGASLRHGSWTRLACLLGACGLALMGSLPLWWPALAHLYSVGPSGVFYVSPQPLTDFAQLLLFNSTPQWAVLCLGFVGLFSWGRSARRGESFFLAGAAGLLLLLAFFGSYFPTLWGLQPVRYKTAGLWLLVPPAATTLGHLGQWLWLAKPASIGSTSSKWPGSLDIPVRLLATVLTIRALSPGLVAMGLSSSPLVRPLAKPHRQLLEWLAAQTKPHERIAFEDFSSKDFLGPYYPEFFADPQQRELLPQRVGPLVPLWTRCSVIGGLYYPCYLKHAYAQFGNGRLFHQPLGSPLGPPLPSSAFERLVHSYNLGWAVVWSPVAREYFRAQVGPPQAQFGPYEIYRLANQPNFCLTGSAQLTLGWNRLELHQPQPDPSGTLILKFHWTPGLVVEPSTVVIEPAGAPGNPLPWIQLKLPSPPPEKITVRGQYLALPEVL